ncbi:MAG: hypothetical protein RL616_968 [Verrucomicrobiota bacterium]|jgi:hypothetical protein
MGWKELACLLLKDSRMTNTSFTVREKSGVSQISLLPANKQDDAHFGLIDGALVLGFLVAFVGLVFLLAK